MNYKPGDRVVLIVPYENCPKGTELTLGHQMKSIDSTLWWIEPFTERPHGMCVMTSHFKKLEQCRGI